MKKRWFKTLCLTGLMAACFGAGVFAAGTIEEIRAYLDYGITVKLDGEVQPLYDANGKRIYPITYQGTTYLPVRAVSNMLDIPVQWDGASRTVLLGETETAQDFINTLQPYAVDGLFDVYQTRDGVTETIAGRQYDHWIWTSSNSGGYYDLGGRYQTLTFEMVSDFDATLYFYGDNEELLATCTAQENALPKTHTVDVSGVTQLLIAGECFGDLSGRTFHVMNMTIR